MIKRISVKHLKQYIDRTGRERLYYRAPKGGKSVPLRGPVGSPAFWEDYLAASNVPSSKTIQRGGRDELRWLVNQYYESAAFRQLGKRTQYVRKGILESFCDEHGGKPYAKLEPKHIRKIRDKMSDTPGQANNVMKTLRQVFKFAVDYDLATTNPFIQVEYLHPKKKGGFHAWTLEEVEQYESCHPIGTKARLALALLLYTGQRRGDIVTLGRQHERDGWLHFTQQKTGKKMSIPIVSDLRRILDASPTGDMTYLVTSFNKPFTSNGWGNRFRKWCDDAGLPQCSSHGLRKAMGYRLAEAGCTTNQIAAIGGWDTLKEVERYTKAAAQKRLAGEAGRTLDCLTFDGDLSNATKLEIKQ